MSLPLTGAQALYLYRCVYAAFIVWASAKTFVEGWPGGGHGHGGAHMALFIRGLAGAEIVAAVALLWLPAQVWAAGALVLIFAIATVLDLSLGGQPVRFAYYAATALVLVYLDRVAARAI
jgi:hypothetical protein